MRRIAARGSRHPVGRLLAGEEGVQVVQALEAHGVAGLQRRAAHVRQQEGVGQAAVAGVDVRLALVDVEPGGGTLGNQRPVSVSIFQLTLTP